MRTITCRLYILFGSCATLSSAQFPAKATYAPEAAWLFPRQDQCPGNTFQCPSSLGTAFSDVCCQNGQTCALDNENNPACCPASAVCTGAAPTGPQGPATAVSYVDNTYFSFPYAPTDFADLAACSSASNACDDNFDVCTANLGDGDGGSNGLTIDVPGGGGITVDATGQTLGPAATSICSSLRAEACSRLEATSCEDLADDSAATNLHVPIGLAVFASIVLLHAVNGIR